MAPTRFRFVLLSFLGLVLGFQLFRLAFLWHFQGLGLLGEAGTLQALYLGLKFDARLAALLVTPAWLLLRPGQEGKTNSWQRWAAPLSLALSLSCYVALVVIAMVDDREARPWLLAFLASVPLHRCLFPRYGLTPNRSARWVWGTFAGLVLAAVILGYFADFGAFSYIHTRLNGTLLMFMENAGISLQMMWESYPVLRGALALALLLGLSLWALRRLSQNLCASSRPAWMRYGSAVLASLALIFAMYGKWSRYPLRWAEAFEAKHSFQAHLALNPLLFFLETRQEMDGGYDLEKVKATHALMAEYFGMEPTFDANGLPSLAREGKPFRVQPEALNVVFIQLESLALFKTGLGGNALKPTPFLDDLAARSLFFDRFHVVMENTSRSMFATLFGIPDVSSVQNATRNPLLVDQHTVLSALNGYASSFWLGGSANWAQIRGVLKNNLKDIVLHEEGSFPGVPVPDVWGISDVDLLLQAHDSLQKETRPFWAYIQTSGNHPPFTIPTHLKDFQQESRSPEALKAAGFVSNEEFNAVRLMDYSLRRYFEAAEKSPYYSRTVFVIFADHGVPRGSQDPRFGDLSLAIHSVPCIIHAPRLASAPDLKPRRISTVASQMDILPTVISLLGRPYHHQSLGKDLMDPKWEGRSAAFTFTTFRRPPRLGLLQDGCYLNLEPDGRPALYSLDPKETKDLSAEDPQRTARMKALAEGFYHWSRYLLSHNKPMDPSNVQPSVKDRP